MVKNHKADSFDGGRAPSLISEPYIPANIAELVLGDFIKKRDQARAQYEDDARALTAAIMALTCPNE